MIDVELSKDERAVLEYIVENECVTVFTMHRHLNIKNVQRLASKLTSLGLVCLATDTLFKTPHYEPTRAGVAALMQPTQHDNQGRLEALENALRETSDMLAKYAGHVLVVGAKSPRQRIEENRKLLAHSAQADGEGA